VASDTTPGTVSVLLNTTTPGATTPSFATQQTFAAGNQPYWLAVADVNGDGKPDLIVANFDDNDVSVLLNTTTPGATTLSFATQQTFATGTGPNPWR
jgi:trimeric autotransporter adhesin